MAFEELKAKQSVVWGTGPYQNVTETITDIHERVVDRLAPADGVRGSTSRAAPERSPSGPPRQAQTSPASTLRRH